MAYTYNFDERVDRKNTSCIKHDFGMEYRGREDLLPLWVADMDFRLPQEVLEELAKTVQHGVFGYTGPKEDYYQAVQLWYRQQFGWETQQEWIVITPGIVYALAQAILAFTDVGDGVLIQQPVYYPFARMIEANARKVVNSELLYENGAYKMDYADLEQKIVENQIKLFLLCSPHNPVGRVWTREELVRLGEICVRHDVIVVADEIHADFVYPEHRHQVFADLNPQIAALSVVCTAPSKTFNLAGMQISNIFIPNKALREKFAQQVDCSGYGGVNVMGLAATKAVYTKGRPWYEALKRYLKGNVDFAIQFFAQRIPEIHVVQPEGTYLLWLDCTGLGLTENELKNLILNKAKLWLDRGGMFGAKSALFERINYACPRSVLQTALEQLEFAVIALRKAREEKESS